MKSPEDCEMRVYLKGTSLNRCDGGADRRFHFHTSGRLTRIDLYFSGLPQSKIGPRQRPRTANWSSIANDTTSSREEDKNIDVHYEATRRKHYLMISKVNDCIRA